MATRPKSEYMFIPQTWADDCYPQTLPIPCDGQFCINSQLIDECDLLFAVIINGTGTPYVKDGEEFPCATLYETYYHSRINKKNSYIFLNADDARKPHLDWINENGMGLLGKGNQDEFEKNVFEKITMILNRWVESQTKHNNASKLLTFDARCLSDAASELIVYAMLANKKAIYVDDGKIFLDLTERKKHPFYFDFPLKGNKTVDDVLQELTGCGLLTALNQEEYELTKLVEEHREKLIQRDDNRILKQANETLVLLLQKIRPCCAICLSRRCTIRVIALFATSATVKTLGNICRGLRLRKAVLPNTSALSFPMSKCPKWTGTDS